MLILAGIFAGIFKVFGLHLRGIVLLAGLLAAVTGGLLAQL